MLVRLSGSGASLLAACGTGGKLARLSGSGASLLASARGAGAGGCNSSTVLAGAGFKLGAAAIGPPSGLGAWAHAVQAQKLSMVATSTAAAALDAMAAALVSWQVLFGPKQMTRTLGYDGFRCCMRGFCPVARPRLTAMCSFSTHPIQPCDLAQAVNNPKECQHGQTHGAMITEHS